MMERVVRWAEILGQVVGAIVILYVAAGVLWLLLNYPAGYRGPISPTEIALGLFALAYGAVATLDHMIGTTLQEPVKVWELILAGFLIVVSLKGRHRKRPRPNVSGPIANLWLRRCRLTVPTRAALAVVSR